MKNCCYHDTLYRAISFSVVSGSRDYILYYFCYNYFKRNSIESKKRMNRPRRRLNKKFIFQLLSSIGVFRKTHLKFHLSYFRMTVPYIYTQLVLDLVTYKSSILDTLVLIMVEGHDCNHIDYRCNLSYTAWYLFWFVQYTHLSFSSHRLLFNNMWCTSQTIK